MIFAEALEVLKDGGAVRLPSWDRHVFIKFSRPVLEGHPGFLEVHNGKDVYHFTTSTDEVYRDDWEDVQTGDYLISRKQLEEELRQIVVHTAGPSSIHHDNFTRALKSSLLRFEAFRVER